jgi:integrase
VRKPPSLRNNNGAIQVRVRIDGIDRFINRLGRYSDPVAIARAHTLSAQIWEDHCSGKLDCTLDSYRPVPQDSADQSLIVGLTNLFHANGQGRVRHALRLVETYGRPLRTRSEVAGFIKWMEDRGIAPQTRVGILSTFRRVNPEQAAFTGHRIRVPGRSVLNDILSKSEVSRILEHLKTNDAWYYPIFFLWLSTGLRNSELIGLTWDCIDWEQSECKITKSLKRREDSSVLREWGDTKNKKHRVVPLMPGVLKVLEEHQQQMQQMNLYQPEGLLFLTKKTRSNLYDALLERVWRRTLKTCGIKYRRLYAQRHTFLSHTLASGNSPADVAAVAGHRLEVLLSTYAKPTGKLKLVEWE